MATVYVRPMPGRKIIDPDRHDRLPAEEWRPVPYSSYWAGLARDRDIELRPDKPPDSAIEGHAYTPRSPDPAPARPVTTPGAPMPILGRRPAAPDEEIKA